MCVHVRLLSPPFSPIHKFWINARTTCVCVPGKVNNLIAILQKKKKANDIFDGNSIALILDECVRLCCRSGIFCIFLDLSSFNSVNREILSFTKRDETAENVKKKRWQQQHNMKFSIQFNVEQPRNVIHIFDNCCWKYCIQSSKSRSGCGTLRSVRQFHVLRYVP